MPKEERENIRMKHESMAKDVIALNIIITKITLKKVDSMESGLH